MKGFWSWTADDDHEYQSYMGRLWKYRHCDMHELADACVYGLLDPHYNPYDESRCDEEEYDGSDW